MTAVAMLPRAMLCHCLTPSRRCCAVVRSVATHGSTSPIFSRWRRCSLLYAPSPRSTCIPPFPSNVSQCAASVRGEFQTHVSAHAVSIRACRQCQHIAVGGVKGVSACRQCQHIAVGGDGARNKFVLTLGGLLFLLPDGQSYASAAATHLIHFRLRLRLHLH